MQPIERVLTLWEVGLLSSESVVQWADQQILQSDNLTQELIDLSCDGPEKCLQRAEFEFSARPVALSFAQGFALRALFTDLQSEESTSKFADWIARHAMGEDVTVPEVAFAYRVDHLLSDCNDREAAIAHIRERLPSMLDRCRSIASPFLEQPSA
jgi:hypothetical protein